ncbi:2-oxoacid:acceptor oxidoreductase subunit alpha [Nitrogeniibacter aestuarii]|uniref:2-oxoacid:acceptor oxidoreductase subunit alpha n=1 Tax=Nitrogeniibacter aestuarii TaxID=2815343 RepID=UPI001D10668C|nr:2-oxoacid:acceptor oxidoreductase subunit alpha [Nitrogeniibacter aestuarii]
MDSTSISIALSGSGGTGVMTAGSLLLDVAARAGYYGLMTRTLGPQIRGGEAAALMRLGVAEVTGPDDTYHMLLALDWGNIERFSAEIPLNAESIVISDPVHGLVPEVIASTGARLVEIPLGALAATVADGRPNMVALGVLTALLGLTHEHTTAVVAAELADRDDETLAASLGAVQAGFSAADPCVCPVTLSPPARAVGTPRWALSGNEATGVGALRGGVRFVAAYPITPATDILEYLAVHLPRLGGALVQAEDELASINMILGSSFGGTPSLTATSGPGLALMTESIGLGIASEVPVVICNVMRGGPSTGIPTKSEQSDLNIAIHGVHGDAPHVVTAPTSISDCVFTTQWSVHLAECLQVPVITLSDQAMGQARTVIDAPAIVPLNGQRKLATTTVEHYERYEVTADGISPMALPGTPGLEYTADGLEHSPRGTPSTQAAHHQEQLDKRQRKLLQFDYGPFWADIAGDGAIAILTWGSVTGAAMEAAERLRRGGVAVKVIAMRLLSPALPDRLADALVGVDRVLVVEQSHSQQFLHYLRGHFALPVRTRTHARPGPVSIRPAEIMAAVDDLFQEA